MKKLLIIITLFVSSFFLISIEDAKAYEYTKEVDFSLIEDTLSLKEKMDIFIQEDITYSDYYFIYSNNGIIRYYILPLDGSLENFKSSNRTDYISFSYSKNLMYGTNLDNIHFSSSASNISFYTFSSINNHINSFILYSNFDLFFTSAINSTITYTYNNFSFIQEIAVGNKFLDMLDIYTEYQKFTGDYVEPEPEEHPYQDEIDKITNFYTIVIEKIEYLANEISDNYILLFIIGIFIITFVFLLIFRRFL